MKKANRLWERPPTPTAPIGIKQSVATGRIGGAGRNRTPYGIENKGFPLESTVVSDQILNFRWGLAQISTIPDFVVRPHSPGCRYRKSRLRADTLCWRN
jgi:hypothetical protein